LFLSDVSARSCSFARTYSICITGHSQQQQAYVEDAQKRYMPLLLLPAPLL
jgi:hypothetical protein